MLQMLLDEQLLKADEVQTEIDVLSRDTGKWCLVCGWVYKHVNAVMPGYASST